MTEHQLSQDSAIAGAVRSLLEASVNNLTEAHMVEGGAGTEDLHYFLDFTTAVLGSPAQEYQQYTTKIQAEYVHLPTAAYNQLRLKVRNKCQPFLPIILYCYNGNTWQ